MTELPCWPIAVLDVAGSVLALALGLLCVLVARKLKAKHAEDVFIAYLWLFTSIVLVFVMSRSVGHLVKQILILSGNDSLWASVAPFSGAINTATFIAVFVISAFFGVMDRMKARIRRSATETARAQALASESEARTREIAGEMNRLNAVFEGVDASIYVCGDGRVKYFNRRMEQLFPEVRLGAPCNTLLCSRSHSDDIPCMTMHTTDDARVLSVSGVPIKWTDQSQARLVAAFDVTELRRAQEQLRHAQKMEALGTLAGGIAHDFNNILCGVVGYGELAILEALPGTPLRGYLTRINESAHRARDLVKRILTFAREAENELQPLDIKPILGEALELVRATFPATLELRSALSSVSAVMADPTQVHQVIINLCTNAASAIGARPGLLEVELDEVDLDEAFALAHAGLSPGRHLRLRVTDDGCGMTPEVRERIFEPFFTTRENDGGTGLGLSVVHGIVAGCKGAITVHSEPGNGTTFNVFLPAVEAQVNAEVDPREVPRGMGERVLFVDDDAANAELGRAMLNHLGYRVTTTTTSERALTAIRSSPDDFDIVIANLTMPKMRGDTLAGAIRAIRPNVPVLITTGYSATRAQVWRSRGGQVLTKPFTMQEIAVAVRRCLHIEASETRTGTPRTNNPPAQPGGLHV